MAYRRSRSASNGMDFAFVYIIQRFFCRFVDFFHHWYVDGSRYIAHTFLSTLTGMDKTFAVGITLRHFFEPLYKDYSIVGRILGIVFRSGRVAIGGAVYFVALIFCLFLYLIWVAIPAVLIILIIRE